MGFSAPGRSRTWERGGEAGERGGGGGGRDLVLQIDNY